MSETAQDSPAEPELRCPGCGYDLRGIEGSDRCPECGLRIDRATLTAAAVPWAHRRVIGTRRAYRRTLWLAMLHPSRLAEAVGETHRWDDARAFRARTARRAYVPFFTVILLIYAITLFIRGKPRELRSVSYQFAQLLEPLGLDWAVKGRIIDVTSVAWAAEVAVLFATLVAAYLAVLASASIGGYFFRPAGMPAPRQVRAAALGAYACAPLLLLAPATLLILLAGYEVACRSFPGFDVFPRPWYRLDTFPRVAMLALALTAVPWGWAWVTTLLLLRRATGCGPGRLVAAGLCLPVAWLLLPPVIIVGTFLSALLLAMVVVNFT